MNQCIVLLAMHWTLIMIRRKTKYMAFDVETTGLQPYKGDRIFAFCTCDEEGNAEVYRILCNRTRLQSFLNDTSTLTALGIRALLA